MKIKPKQYAIGLYEATRDLPTSKIKVAIENFVKILVKNNALRMAPQILDYFQKYTNKIEGIADLKIKTVELLKEENLSQLKILLPALLKKEIKKINIQQKIDPNLIGGFTIECDDLVFDASVKNKFSILKKNLI
jgi:F-type H+-transporting ATPase subunit delta